MPSTNRLAGAGAASSRSAREKGQQAVRLDALFRRLRLAGAEPLPPDEATASDSVILGRAITEGEWDELRKRLDTGAVTLAFGDLVEPQCPLLSAEPATAVGTALGLQVPEGSAWVCMRVDLPRFARPDGTFEEDALHKVLESCVDVGDAIHDVVHWPTAEQRYDAWLNRRLAVMLAGIGDLAACSKEDPGSHETLRRLNQLLLGARYKLQSRSRAIALRCDRLPAITLSDPSHRLPAGSFRDDWQRRWQRAVRVSLVRHRNLLALSPWSLFPADRPADLRYAEFLPVLRHADVVAFNKTVSTSHWNLNEFKHFCLRARAVLRQRNATSLIA
jgi:hypothetical protein